MKADAACLRLAITHKVGATMKRMALRGTVQSVGTRERATLWRMA